MPRQYYCFALTLCLLLSQWLSLGHATDHLFEDAEQHCAVCSLQSHHQAVTLSAAPGALAGHAFPPAPAISGRYSFKQNHTDSIRAPPVIST